MFEESLNRGRLGMLLMLSLFEYAAKAPCAVGEQ
jgi:hypothetical protein